MAEDDKYVPSKGNSDLNPTSGGSAFVRDSKGLLTRKTDSGWFAGDGLEAVEKRNKEMASSAFERNSGGMLTKKSELEANNKTLAKMDESAFGRNRLGLLTRKGDIESNNKNDSVASIRTQADFFKKSKPSQRSRSPRNFYKGGIPMGGYASKFNFKSSLYSSMTGGGGFSLPDLNQFCPLAGQVGSCGSFNFDVGFVKSSFINDVTFPTPIDSED
jgi:hypothetical protein